MKQNRFLLGIVFGLIAIAAACASDVTNDQGYYITHTPKGKLVGGPEPFMLAVGCIAVTSNPDTGGIAIPLPSGRPAVFSCRNVRRDSVNAARVRYYAAVDSLVVGPHITANGYWALEFVGSREWCSVDGGGWGADNRYHIVSESQIAYCFNVDTYQQYWINTSGNPEYDDPPSGGGSAPMGDPQPAEVTVDSIALSSEEVMTEVGSVSPLITNTVYLSDHTTHTGFATWSSQDGAIATPDDQGTFMGVSAGVATVVASYGDKTKTATVTVGDGSIGDPDNTAGISSGLLADIESLNMTFDCTKHPCPKPITIAFSPSIVTMTDSMQRWTARTGVEHGVKGHWNSDGSFSFSGTYSGEFDHVSIPPDDSMVVEIHGHVFNDLPSGNDADYSIANHVYGVVGTPTTRYVLSPTGQALIQVAKQP